MAAGTIPHGAKYPSVPRRFVEGGLGTWHAVAIRMTTFFRRLMGVLMLEASAYEEIEAHPRAGMQSVLVVLAVTAAGGFAGFGLGLIGIAGFVTGAVVALGGWLVWVSIISTLGTTALAEPQTRSNPRELLRTLGFASAPGMFLGFAAIRPAAPVVFVIVAVWMIAAAVLAVRQALDFRHAARAVAVCVLAWLLTMAFVAVVALIASRSVT